MNKNNTLNHQASQCPTQHRSVAMKKEDLDTLPMFLASKWDLGPARGKAQGITSTTSVQTVSSGVSG